MKWKLEPDTIPKMMFFKNLRSELEPYQWDRIRRHCYRKANYKCEICGGIGSSHPVECHEEWEFDFSGGYQILKGVTALCPSCHEVKHIGLANKRGRLSVALDHMAKINEKSIADCLKRLADLATINKIKNESISRLDIHLADKLEQDAVDAGL